MFAGLGGGCIGAVSLHGGIQEYVGVACFAGNPSPLVRIASFDRRILHDPWHAKSHELRVPSVDVGRRNPRCVCAITELSRITLCWNTIV